MKYRLYGEPKKILLHGGPGAKGSVSGFAMDLDDCIEVLNHARTIEGQLQEIKAIVDTFELDPPIIIGHSWGAWLAYLYAAHYKTGHIVLIGCGPFKASYLDQMNQSRENNLTQEEQKKVAYFFKHMLSMKSEELYEFGKLMTKMDAYHLEGYKDQLLEFDSNGHQSLMHEIRALRASGDLLDMGKKINASITIIHGKDDPHPYQGILEPFDEIGLSYESFLLDNCGHTPWVEKYARASFYKIMASL